MATKLDGHTKRHPSCFIVQSASLWCQRARFAHAPRVTETPTTWRVSRARSRARAVYDHVAMHFLFQSSCGRPNDRVPDVGCRRTRHTIIKSPVRRIATMLLRA